MRDLLNDAWPTAEIAVMGAKGAVEIIVAGPRCQWHRSEDQGI
jgi:acetyl-CoA carboxylase carboxyltransferase component